MSEKELDIACREHLSFDVKIGNKITFVTLGALRSDGKMIKAFNHRTGSWINLQPERLRRSTRWPSPRTPGYGTDRFEEAV